MKRIHYLLIILAAMLVYAGKIWLIPLLPETITVDDKIIIKKPMFYLAQTHSFSDEGNNKLIIFTSRIRSTSISYSFEKEKDKNTFVLDARISTGMKDIKTDICYLQEERAVGKYASRYRGYAIYAYPYIAGFHGINLNGMEKRMTDFKKQICKDESGADRKVILLEGTKIIDRPHPSKSQIPLK